MSPPAAASTSPTEGPPTRIEVLYLDGCPNHEPVLARVRELLAPDHEQARIELVRIDSDADARDRRFLGSPTLRIDGVDVEPGADERGEFTLACRIYQTATGPRGRPDEAWIRATLMEKAP
jgi:hypothetical protein